MKSWFGRIFIGTSAIAFSLASSLVAHALDAHAQNQAVQNQAAQKHPVQKQAVQSQAAQQNLTGALEFSDAEYKFDATVDNEILKDTYTEIWARAFWPKDLSKPRPILFLLHGNHGTCGNDATPRNDWDCSYTNEGSCPTGMTVVANHDGYIYLGEALAAQGYIVVSINANRGITCGGGNDQDWGLNLARGRLILRHIENWKKWATNGAAPASLGVAPDTFVGKVDFSNVGLMGHSRGGEGARAAYNIYRETNSVWPSRIPGLEIRGIFEIGAVDGQTSRVLDADDTAWNQLLPMCDGDVSDLQGRKPFERMLLKGKETRKTPKSLTMVWGTNHNFYNTEWQTSDSYGCTGHDAIFGTGPVSEPQKKIAVEMMSAFFQANVGANHISQKGNAFDPSSPVPASWSAITKVERDHYYTYDEFFSVRVDDFDQPTGTSSARVANEANGVTVRHETYDLPKRAEVTWGSANTNNFFQVNWTEHGVGRDIGSYSHLDVRIGRLLGEVSDKTPTDLSIELVDAAGGVSKSVPVSKFAEIVGPANDTQLYQTVRIPMSEFGVTASTKVRGVRFVFDRSGKGAIALANVRFTVRDPSEFESSRNLPLESLDPQLHKVADNKPPQVQPQPEPQPNPSTNPSADPSATPTPIDNFGNNQVLPPPPNTPVMNLPVNAVNSSSRISRFANQTPVPKVQLFKASVVGLKGIARSRALSGRSAIEIAIKADTQFPVEAQLPTLVMANNKFSVSRYLNGKTHTLIFSVPRAEFAELPKTGKMLVQYGRTNPRKIWKLKNYDKGTLGL